MPICCFYVTLSTKHDPLSERTHLVIFSTPFQLQIDFWAEPRHAGRPVDFMLGPDFQDEALRMLSERGLQAEVFIDNVEELIQEQIQPS